MFSHVSRCVEGSYTSSDSLYGASTSTVTVTMLFKPYISLDIYNHALIGYMYSCTVHCFVAVMTILLEATSCLSGWSLSETSCYRLFSSEKNWNDAEANCVTKSGHLVSITSNIENSFVYKLAKESGKDVWIGLKIVKNSFVWSDGTTCLYRQWDKNQPSRSTSGCTKVTKGNGLWNDKDCSDKRFYVCESPTLTTHPPALTNGVNFGNYDFVKLFKIVAVV